MPVPTPDPITPRALNPYKESDKVKTKCKGADVAAEVVGFYKDEVQIKMPDGERRWRTVRTVEAVIEPLTPPDPMDEFEPAATPRKVRRATKKHRRRG